MEFMQTWRRSLELLRPERLKPFLMVTAKTVLDVYKGMNRPLTSRGNWIMAVTIFLLIALTNLIQLFYLFWFESMFLNAIRYFLFFIFALDMRASVGLKDQTYFLDYLKRFRYALTATILVGITPLFAIPFLLQWWMFFLFFLFDAGSSFKHVIKSKGQATKIMLYNLPLCALLELLLRIIGFFLYKLVSFAVGYWGGITLAVIAYLIVVPIEVAFISNLYIKFFHDQPDSYLKQHIG